MASRLLVKVVQGFSGSEEIFEVEPLKSIKEFKQELATPLGIKWQQLKLLLGEDVLADATTLGQLAGPEVTLQLVVCAAPVSVTGSFEHFDENWQIVPTAANDPHGTYLYDPRASAVVLEPGRAILSCRGRVASRAQVPCTEAVVITGNFKFSGDREDFLSVHYGVRPLHTGLHPYGSLDDGNSGIGVNFHYRHGSIDCGVFGRGREIHCDRQHIADECECRFRVVLDPKTDAVYVRLDHGGHEVKGKLEGIGFAAAEFPGQSVVLYNREFRDCVVTLWDVEVFIAEDIELE